MQNRSEARQRNERNEKKKKRFRKTRERKQKTRKEVGRGKERERERCACRLSEVFRSFSRDFNRVREPGWSNARTNDQSRRDGQICLKAI